MNKVILILVVFFLNCFSFAQANLPYDFTNTDYMTIKMTPLQRIATDGDFYEGQEVKFKVRNNVYCHGLTLVKKGTIATARIETIITKGMNGFPAEIILNNFKIDGINESQLMGEYIETGRNWALMVYPIKWILTPIPFAGSLTNFIMGGEARIETDEVISIKFYPHWK